MNLADIRGASQKEALNTKTKLVQDSNSEDLSYDAEQFSETTKDSFAAAFTPNKIETNREEGRLSFLKYLFSRGYMMRDYDPLLSVERNFFNKHLIDCAVSWKEFQA